MIQRTEVQFYLLLRLCRRIIKRNRLFRCLGHYIAMIGKRMIVIKERTITSQFPTGIIHKKPPVLLMPVIVIENIIRDLHF